MLLPFIQPFFYLPLGKELSYQNILSNRSGEGLTLETPAFKLLTVANLRFQLSS